MRQGAFTERRRDWRQAAIATLDRRVLALSLLGFSAGLPFLLIFGTLGLWLREAGFERGDVTYFSWAALGYSFKFVWAPLIDKMPVPVLGRMLGQRRSWMLVAQLGVIGALVFMASTDPVQQGLVAMAVGAVALGFASATQDIVIDAYRIEVADETMQALLSSAYVAGYRVGMFAAGAGALYLAGWLGTTVEHYVYGAWRWTYLVMAAAMLVGVATTLAVPEPARRDTAKYLHSAADYGRFVLLFVVVVGMFVFAMAAFPSVFPRFDCEAGDWCAFAWEALRLLVAAAIALGVAWVCARIGLVRAEMARDTYVDPVRDFFARYRKGAVVILLLVGFYRVSDIVLGVIANVFYLDMGYSKEMIATATKTFGIWPTIFGGFLGGWLALRFGTLRILMLGAVLTVVTNLLFIALAESPGDIVLLYAVVGADNLTAGLATAAFVAYLSSLTSLSFTAMQYAIFSSLMTLFPKLLGGYSGTLVDQYGYSWFFLGAALIGVPVFLLVALVKRHASVEHAPPSAVSGRAA